MIKRFFILVAVLALMLAAAVPAALAQEQASATGVLRAGLPADVGGLGTHSIEDEATGELYALRSAGADLDSYVGQQVTVYGALTPGEESSGEEGFGGSGTLPSIDVTRVESADGPIEGEEITANFELAVECEPPAGTTFFAGASQQTVGLEDPDGDGVYEGSLTLPADFGTFPVDVAILSGTPEDPQQTIKYFGEMVLEDGDAFSASASFCDDGSGNGGGSNNGSNNTVSGDTGAGGSSGGSGSSSGSGSASASGSAAAGGGSGAKVLPATGGTTLLALGAGALLVVGGLLARRIAR